MSEQISTIPKNEREKIIVSLSNFKGKHYVDMRIFTANDNGGQDIPTKKGLTVPLQLYPAFRDTLQGVDKALITRGLMDREDLAPQK
jgi:hypothetical protein